MTIPAVVPPLPRAVSWDRHVAPATALSWLSAGWRDFTIQPAASLSYGLLVFLISSGIVAGLFAFGWDYILFPAFAGFMVVGPVLGVGLYEKSRRIAAGERVSLIRMIFVKPKSGGQLLFAGVMLCLLMLLWMRAAVIIYALFFGLRPFPGLDHIAPMLFTTQVGWAMLIVGGAVGGLFAAFSFAISVFAVPMLLNERVDALTAMGTSMALVWANLPVMLTWAAIVLALFLVSLATGLLGMIVAFPVLGHGTWHAYRTMRPGV
ncbi:MAG: putative transrane protein [Tardiphaga sp.]|nr:putative transrane protein [Tardiphaga sp.]